MVKACSRTDVGNAELSRLAGSDPILTAELLRVANSPFFGIGHEIRSLTRAITVLGHQTLSNLALCLAVRESVRSSGGKAESFWEDALIRGAGARLLAQAVRENAEEAFTAGILQDFGMHVLLHLDPVRAGAWAELRGLDPDARHAREYELFGIAHDDVVRLLAHGWELPPELARALGGQHHCGAADAVDVSALARVLYLADWMAAVFRSGDQGAALRSCRRIAGRSFSLAEHRTDELLAGVPLQVGAAAKALEVATPAGLDFERVLAEAGLDPDG